MTEVRVLVVRVEDVPVVLVRARTGCHRLQWLSFRPGHWTCTYR